MIKSLRALTIIVWLYALLAVGLLFIANFATEINTSGLVILAIVSIVIALATGFVRSKLAEGKYWAWIISIIGFGFCTFSILFPIGIYGLLGALSQETRQSFARLDLAHAAHI